MKALLINSDPEVQRSFHLAFLLMQPSWEIIYSKEGAKGVELAGNETPQMVYVDGSLPDMEGTEVVRWIRQFADMPMIIFNKTNDEMTVARGLESGADDCITKPIGVIELLSRTRTLLRRSIVAGEQNSGRPPFISPRLVIDYVERQVAVEGQPIHLTPTEYKLLCTLATNAGRLVSMQMLKKQVWQDAEFVNSNTVRKSISQLRQKLDDRPAPQQIIINERGIGYKIAPPQKQ